jgi:acyl carrier protein
VPADPSLVDPERLGERVRDIIAEVLVVARDRVRPHSALIADLGAESIDFLDLIFHLEESLGKDIPPQRWYEFVRHRLPDQDPSHAITTDIVREFAEQEAARCTGPPISGASS